MKEAISTETVADVSHSRIPKGNGYNNSGKSLKSATMLGIALSVGASGALISQAEASAAVSIPTNSDATKAFSSNSEASVPVTEAVAAHQVVGYHTVEPGESLWQIAQQYHVGLRELKSTNALPQETAIRVGQILKVPGSPSGSTVEPATPTSQLIAGITAAEATGADASALNLRPAAIQRSDSQLSSYRLNDELNDEAVADRAVEPTVSDINVETVASNQPPSPAAISVEIADASIKKGAATESTPVITAMATPSAFQQYRVQSGDTLSAIASSLGTTPQKLIQANALANPNVILAGDTLRVPASSQPSASNNPSNNSVSRVVSGAQRSESRLVADLRNATPQAPASVGGEQVTAKDLLGSAPAARAEGVDPYVANLLAEVQQIRSQRVSEVNAANSAIVEGDAVQNVAQGNVRNNVQSNVAETSASRLLARSEQPNTPAVMSPEQSAPSSPSIAKRVSLAPTAQPSATEVDSELLAAAPLSPDAYIPAQRSGEPQVVSPDMPILPGANEYLPETPSYFNGYIWPARGTVTSGFGWRWGRMHRGVDVAGPVGTPVVAASSGVIASAGWNSGGYGNMVEIQHSDGSMTRYAHNNRLNVSVGQAVKQGQQIAEMGSTGYSTGPHLHFEVHPNGGAAVNPVAYLPTSGPS